MSMIAQGAVQQTSPTTWLSPTHDKLIAEMALSESLQRLDEILQANHDLTQDLAARVDELQRTVLPKGKMISATILEPNHVSDGPQTPESPSELQRENLALRYIIKVRATLYLRVLTNQRSTKMP